MNRRTRTSVLDQPREHAPCLLVSVTCWLLACPLFAGAWVAERDIKIERDAAAQVWPVSSLGPGGDRPFKFIPGASALLSISCEIVSYSLVHFTEQTFFLSCKKPVSVTSKTCYGLFLVLISPVKVCSIIVQEMNTLSFVYFRVFEITFTSAVKSSHSMRPRGVIISPVA